MKKFFVKSFSLAFILLFASCAEGNYMKTVSFWHMGNFLQFVAIVAIAALLYFIYTKFQNLEDSIRQLTDELMSLANRQVNNVSTPQQQSVNTVPQQPSGNNVSQSQQTGNVICPDCGSTCPQNATACPSCGCPLNG